MPRFVPASLDDISFRTCRLAMRRLKIQMRPEGITNLRLPAFQMFGQLAPHGPSLSSRPMREKIVNALRSMVQVSLDEDGQMV